MYTSEDYIKWVHQSGLPPLTGTQHEFAEWLLQPEQAKVLRHVGDLNPIFESVRRFVKVNKLTHEK